MTDDFKWDVDSLARILNTREAYTWPYEAEYNGRSEREIVNWLKIHCKGEYKITAGFRRRLVSFKEEEDYTLFFLTWA